MLTKRLVVVFNNNYTGGPTELLLYSEILITLITRTLCFTKLELIILHEKKNRF